MTIRDTILALMTDGIYYTANSIIATLRAKLPYYLEADDVHAEIQGLVRERWLIPDAGGYRKRTPDQHAQLMAELDGTQPKLL
jgi:hypothetical protein